MRALEIEFDVGGLEEFAGRLATLGPETLGRAMLEAVNMTTTAFDEEQRAGQIKDTNLTPDYVASKTEVRLATDPLNPRAEITTRGQLTLMTQYGPESLRDPERLDRAGRRLGNRQAGMRVPIKRSGATTQPEWFLMRLRNAGGRLGVFVRNGPESVEHLYGPSPYSLFKHQLGVGQIALETDLAAAATSKLREAFAKALK